MSGHLFSPPPDQAMPFTTTYWGTKPADADPLAVRLMGYFGLGARASNVYLMVDGSVTINQPPQWNPDDPTGPVSTTWSYPTGSTPAAASFITNPPSLQVRKVFYGGHANPVTDTEFTLLSAAGYGPPDLV